MNQTTYILRLSALTIVTLCLAQVCAAQGVGNTEPSAPDGWQPLSAEASKGWQPLSVDAPKSVSPPTIGQLHGAPVPPVPPITAVPVTVAPITSTPVCTFELVAGESFETQVMGWAACAHWNMTWNYPSDWVVPGGKSYGTDFAAAIEAAFNEAGSNGADIWADGWKGNHTVTVTTRGSN